MSMTREEKFAKTLIQKRLSEQGYPTYADLLGYFDFNFTTDDGVIAYLEPSKGRIVVNRGLDEDQISVVIRHEILHNYLEHETRLMRKLANESGIDYDNLTDMNVDEVKNIKKTLYGNKDFNIAADYEISNYAYTDLDKETIRKLDVNGRILSGLVTEDEHPDWVDLSVEEMYDELRKERQEHANEPPRYYGWLIDATTFMDINGVTYGA